MPRKNGRCSPQVRTMDLSASDDLEYGYAELESDSRAHTKDLQAVAQTILSNDPDAIACRN